MATFIHPDVSTAALKRFFERQLRNGNELHGLEIVQDGKLLVRWEVEPYSCRDKREMYSLSKSFCSSAVGIACDRGLLQVEDPVLKWFPEYAGLAKSDERWQRLQVRHLLSMSSGHAACTMPQVSCSDDGVRAFFETPLAHEPGAVFVYNTGATCMLAEIVRRATGTPAPQWLAEHLFRPLGIDAFEWQRCVDGRCQGGRGLHLCLDDVLTFGQMILNGGVWQEQRILSEEWIKAATSFQIDNAPSNENPDWRAGYGFQFWQNAKEGFRGDGAYGQACAVFPGRGLVAAMFSESQDMQAGFFALWDLLDELTDEEKADLPAGYAPKGMLDGRRFDTGWRRMADNAVRISALRVKADAEGARIWICLPDGVQVLEAPSGRWQLNELFFPDVPVSVAISMPCIIRHRVKIMAAAHAEGEELVVECRSRNCPHAYTLRFAGPDGQMKVTLHSPLYQPGQEKVLCEA